MPQVVIFYCTGTVGQKKRKTKHPYLFQYKLSYRNEAAPIIMDYCKRHFDALKFFLGVRLHGGGSQNNFNSFNVNPHIFQRNRKLHLSNSLEAHFHNVSNISLRVVRSRNYG